MQKYVALLRGINVGGNSKVEMKKLREVFESLGFENVSTYINSGNVIFEGSKKDNQLIAALIEKSLKKNFGFDIRVVIRDAENIRKVAKAIPKDWKNDTDQKSDVIFLWDRFDKKGTLKLITTNKEVDNLKYVSGAIIWNLKRSDYNKSGMHKFIGTEVYKHMTARNVNIVRKLAALMK